MLLTLGGCADLRERFGPPEARLADPQTENALRAELTVFQNDAQRLIETAADTIASEGGASIRQITTRWKSSTIPQFRRAALADSAVLGLTDSWTIAMRMNDYFTSGVGSAIFLEPRLQARAQRTSRQVLSKIERIAQRHLVDEEYSQIRPQVQEYARNTPITGIFEQTEPDSADAEDTFFGGIFSILKLPLAPFTAAGSIRRGTASVEEAAARMVEIAEDLPSEMRWELEHLMLTVEEMEIMQTMKQVAERLGDATAQVSQAADKVGDATVTVSQAADKVADATVTVSQTVSQALPVFETQANRLEELGRELPLLVRQQADQMFQNLQTQPAVASALDSLDRVSRSSEMLGQTAQSLPAMMNQATTEASDDFKEQSVVVIDHLWWRSIQLLLLAAVLGAVLILLAKLVPGKHRRPA